MPVIIHIPGGSIKIFWRCQIPPLLCACHGTCFVIILMARGFGNGHKGRVAFLIRSCYGYQVILFENDPRTSVWMDQIVSGKQTVYRPFQHSVPLGVAVGRIPVFFLLPKGHIPLVDVNLPLCPVIINLPSLLFPVVTAAVGEKIRRPFLCLLPLTGRMQCLFIGIFKKLRIRACLPFRNCLNLSYGVCIGSNPGFYPWCRNRNLLGFKAV